MESTNKGHEEEVTLRFKIPVYSMDMLCVGVSTAQDFEGNAASGSNILSSKSLNEESAKIILKTKTKVHASERVIRVVDR